MAAIPEDIESPPALIEIEPIHPLRAAAAVALRLATETGETTGQDLYLPGTVAGEAALLVASADVTITEGQDGNAGYCALGGTLFCGALLLTATTLTWAARHRR